MEEENYPLFETRRGRGRVIYKIFSFSLFVGICSIYVYRVSYIPKEGEDGKWVWIGLLCAELWFGLCWVLRQALRWNPVFRQPFTHRLSQRYENMLPGVDIFVCTADPGIEPPIMVMNTVLSVMAYDYPAEKLSVYLSDDAGSDITFCALLEASNFAKHWLPFCKRFKVEPRSPAAYFKSITSITSPNNSEEFVAIKKLYQDMESRIENITKLGKVPKELQSNHKGFSQWDSYSSRGDHDTILQIFSNCSGIDTAIVGSIGIFLVLSGCGRKVQDDNFKEYDMWLAAENGIFLHPSKCEWMTTMPEHLNMEWVDSVKYFTERTPRSHFDFEERETSLVWNDKDAGDRIVLMEIFYGFPAVFQVAGSFISKQTLSLENFKQGTCCSISGQVPFLILQLKLFKGADSLRCELLALKRQQLLTASWGEIVHNKSMTSPIDYVLCIGHFLGKDVYYSHTEISVAYL